MVLPEKNRKYCCTPTSSCTFRSGVNIFSDGILAVQLEILEAQGGRIGIVCEVVAEVTVSDQEFPGGSTKSF